MKLFNFFLSFLLLQTTSAAALSSSLTKQKDSILSKTVSTPSGTLKVPSITARAIINALKTTTTSKRPTSTTKHTTTSTKRTTTSTAKKITSTTKKTTSTTKKTTSTLKKTTSTSKKPTSTTKPVAKPTPAKRGFSYNDVALTAPFTDSTSQISWGYNWYSSSNGLPIRYNFVPMLWSPASEFTSVWFANVKAAIASGTTHVLAFNEPDLNTQSNLSPKVAAAAYKTWMQPLAGKVKLGAPAVTNGGGQMGLEWLRQFMGNCTGCTIDFVPFHWYDSASNKWYFKSYVQQVHQAVGKPLWITEFQGSGTSTEQAAFLKLVMPWLDSLPYIERYAWFGTFTNNLINLDGKTVSALGKVYEDFTGPVDIFFSSYVRRSWIALKSVGTLFLKFRSDHQS